MPIACAITPSPSSARPMDVHSCSSSEARAAALGRPSALDGFFCSSRGTQETSSELWNLRDVISALLWGRCHGQNSARNSAAFLHGRVRHRPRASGCKRIRLGGGRRGQCPRPAHGFGQTGGALAFLTCQSRGCPLGDCRARGGTPSHQNSARPARVVPGSEGTRAES